MVSEVQFKPHVVLENWQVEARDAWLRSRHPRLGPRHGIADVYTGAGKTFLAMACMVASAELRPGLKIAVICPKTLLARQWQREIVKHTTADEHRVGIVGDGSKANFAQHDVVIYVIDSARRVKSGGSLLARDARGHEVLLVVDECHRTGARVSSKIYDAVTWGRLGLSATPQRTSSDACDEDGMPLPIEQQIHGQHLGPVFFSFSLKDGIQNNMLPRFVVHHHAVALTESEEWSYAGHEKNIKDCRESLKAAGGDPDRYRAYINGRRNVTDRQRTAAIALEQAYFARKMFLYKASERLRVAREILVDAWLDEPAPRGAMLFNERIGHNDESDKEDAELGDSEEQRTFGAAALHEQIRVDCDEDRLPFDRSKVVLEHGSLGRAERRQALDAFARGDAKVLVTVKALQEGIDVPDVGLGVSVASTASARQRIQTMGRILRLPRKDGRLLHPDQAPVKHLHMIYVDVDPDKRIYADKDWSAETGSARNQWWIWALGGGKTAGEALAPTELTERDAWADVEHRLPAPWKGPLRAPKFRWRHDDVSKLISGDVVLNPDEVKSVLPNKGQFLVTALLHVVVKYDRASGEWLALGRLTQPFLYDASEEPFGTPGQPEVVAPSMEPAGGSRASGAVHDAIAAEAEDLAETFEGYWYELLQYGFQAAARRDIGTLRACLRVVERARTGRRVPVRQAFEVLLSESLDPDALQMVAEARALDAASLHQSRYQPDLIHLGACAHVAGEAVLLENIEKAFGLRLARTPRNKRQRGEALVNAIRLLRAPRLRGSQLRIVQDESGE